MNNNPTIKNICSIVISHTPEDSFPFHIKAMAIQTDKVVVVNNGSEKLDFQIQDLQKFGLADKIHLIRNSENLGPAKALNQGCEWAISHGYEWVLLIDQDGLPDADMIEQMIKVYSNCPFRDKVKLIAANCVYREMGEMKYGQECRGKTFFEKDILMLTGSLLSLPVYKKIGSFREDFFIDSIDTEYSLRIRKNGFKIIVACKAKMLHGIGEKPIMRNFLGRKIVVTNHNAARCYYMSRNGLIVMKEYFFREPYWAARRIAWHFFVKPALVALYEKDKLRKIEFIYLGLFHGLIGKTGRVF